MRNSRTLDLDSLSPVVVPVSDIPASSTSENGDLEVHPFLAHDRLRSTLPPSGVALSWIIARPGQDVRPRSHSTRRLIVVLHGSAEMTGRTARRVERGDAIMVPSHQEYGFRSIGPDGLQALDVDFCQASGSNPVEEWTLQRLLARNEARTRMALESPFFLLLRDQRLATERTRTAFRDGLRVFSDVFQTILHTRQATCRDPEFAAVFHAHFQEELGHNTLLQTSGNQRAASDPILRATSSWFCHQMLVLDNVDKAVLVHLVLETAGHHFHSLAKDVFAKDVSAQYFDTHSTADEDHQGVAMPLLEGHTPETYRHMIRILDDGWDMFHAMTTRIAELVALETSTS